MSVAHVTHLYLHLLHTTSYYFLMRATRMHVVLYIQTTEKQRISVHIQTMNNPDAAAADPWWCCCDNDNAGEATTAAAVPTTGDSGSFFADVVADYSTYVIYDLMCSQYLGS